jgi:hypothetical protein
MSSLAPTHCADPADGQGTRSLFLLVNFGLLSRWWWMRWAAVAVLVADAGTMIYFWYRNLPPRLVENGDRMNSRPVFSSRWAYVVAFAVAILGFVMGYLNEAGR